jgi:membrane fusion protein, heavy metal efflux system
MKTNMKWLFTVAVIMLFFLGCSREEETETDKSPLKQSAKVRLSVESIKQIKLGTETVSLQTFTGYLTMPAKVITNQDHEAQIGSLVQGRVHQVHVKIGDYVKAGQVLMTVEGLDVGEIKAGFLIAKASYEYSKADYERQKKLFDEKIGSQKSLLESRAEYEKALAEFRAEDMKIHSIGLRDEDVVDEKRIEEHTSGTLPIKSSIDGVVVERNVVIGQSVDASTNAFKVINITSVWIDGQIYEKDLLRLQQKTDAIFTSAAYLNEKFAGKIIYIGQTVDEQTRTIAVRGEFANLNNKLKPHMFGELKIPIDKNKKAILIPEESLFTDGGQTQVFIQTSDTTFEVRKVIIGTSVDNRVEITEGLREGEKVVSTGVFYLKSELKKEEFEGDAD